MIDNTAYDLKSGFSRMNYADLSDQYQNAYDWFESFGLNLAKTRLQQYKACIDELAHYYRDGSLDTASFKRDFERQVTSLFEATEIIRIYKGLNLLYSSGLKDKLQTILSGRNGRHSPSEFDPGRDIGFELLIASRCQRAGLQVEIGAEADLIIHFNGVELFVECKRLKSGKKIKKNIKKGLQQLHRRYKNARNPQTARGLLALSITDSENPDHGLMIGDSPEEVGGKVQRYVDSFILRHQNLWHKKQDKRTIGAFIELSAPAVVEQENLLTICHQVGINNSCPQGTPDADLLMGFAKKLAGQPA